MSDEFKNDIVNVNYVAGEQVTATKLEAVADQLRLAIQRLGSSVGDVLTQQTHAATLGPYSLADLSTAGPNLNRVVGSTGWLNPGTFGRNLDVKQVVFTGHQSAYDNPPIVSGYSHYNRRQFKLPDPPIVFDLPEGDSSVSFNYSYNLGPIYWTISGANPTTLVANLSDLDSTGEYHVSPDGVITLFDPLDDGDSFTVDYTFHPLPDAYDGASLNVIPDFAQTATLCTVAVVSPSIYSVTLPIHTGNRSYPDLSVSLPPDEYVTYQTGGALRHPNRNHQLLLPLVLRDNLSTGDVIPDGFIRLWDDTTGTIVEGLEFTYESTSQVNCTGADLTASSDRYRVIVSGTNLARTVYSLRENARWHDHSGRVLSPSGTYMGSRIHHYDLLNLIDEGDGGTISPGFTVSEIGPTRNPHPMYLHRYGWEYNNAWSDAGNFHNAFMGDLVLGNVDGGLGDSADSFSIYFNDGGPYDSAEIKYDQADNRLEINGSDVYINRDLLLDDNLLIDGGYIETFGGELYTDGGNVETEDPNSAGNGGSILTDGGLIDTGVTTGTGGTIRSGGGVINSEGGIIRSDGGVIYSDGADIKTRDPAGDGNGGDIITDGGNISTLLVGGVPGVGGSIYSGGGDLNTTDPIAAGSGGDIITDGGDISTADVSADGSGGNIHTGSGGPAGSNGGYIQTHGGIVDTDGGHIYVNDGEFRYGSLNKKTQRVYIPAADANAAMGGVRWLYVPSLNPNWYDYWDLQAKSGDGYDRLLYPIHLPELATLTAYAVKLNDVASGDTKVALVRSSPHFGSAVPPDAFAIVSGTTEQTTVTSTWETVQESGLSITIDQTFQYYIQIRPDGALGTIVTAAEVVYEVDEIRAGLH